MAQLGSEHQQSSPGQLVNISSFEW